MSSVKKEIVLAMSLAVLAASTISSQAAVFKKIYQFPRHGIAGLGAEGSLVLGAEGNFYGATARGGKGVGTIFKITPQRQFTTLYEFAGSSDGQYPSGGLVIDSAGNIYGTTIGGGSTGDGTVFKFAADGTETTLHNFGSSDADGRVPASGLTSDDQGNLYGTTLYGGSHVGGIIFEMTPTGTETILHAFKSKEGFGAFGRLFRSGDGALYGTTENGGRHGSGTVYRLNVGGDLQVLHSFNGKDPADGAEPEAGVVLLDGTLYGTTTNGGLHGQGTVYSVKRDGSGETLVTSFDGAAGKLPDCALVTDANGNLFGTTTSGGADDLGVAFKLTRSGKETVLHYFRGADGSFPTGGLTLDQSGNLFGTTSGGSAHGPQRAGTIFEITYKSN